MDIMDIILTVGVVFFGAIIIFSPATSLEDANKKRAAKGKPPFDEDVYALRIKRGRIIGIMILAIAFIIAMAIRALVSEVYPSI